MGYEYTSIDEDRRERSWLWRATFIGTVLIGAILIAALSSVATIGVMTWDKISRAPKQFSCGETFDEAHQRGCTFDPLTLTWLHPECSLYGSQEFQISQTSKNSTWEYWEDKGGSLELGGYEALSLLPPGTSYWMTQEQHLNHCMWMLSRAHDAAITPGKRLDSKSSSPEHARHCLDMLVELASIGTGEKLSQVIVKGWSKDIGWTAC